MAKGTVKWYDGEKGYGFLVNETGDDIFIHWTNIIDDILETGQIVDYEEVHAQGCRQGRNVIKI